MSVRRRDFLGAALSAGVAALTSPALLRAQDAAPARVAAPIPTYVPKVEKLFKTTDRYPNALEATPDGLWVGDQVSERIQKLDWETGKVFLDFVAEAHNTSGLAVGGGYLWIGCNGGGTAAATRPFTRPFDKSYGEIVQCDMTTGKQVKGYRSPWGSQHGTAWARDTNKLWAVAPGMEFAAELDPKDDLRVLRMVSIGGGTPHGIDVVDGALWIMYAADRQLKKFDLSGKVQEIWKLAVTDPDPHGFCIHNGYAYYCDAGLGGGRTPSPGTVPQQMCRFSLTKS
jgi:streptogramin lyase